ncbi:MAG: PEP-utilizing enzyme, partial [Dehalococcoidia bacterium]
LPGEMRCWYYGAARGRDTVTTTAAQPIVPPANFPVAWPADGMDSLFWTWDQVHHPHPKTPLSASFEVPCFSQGSSRGFQGLTIPINYRSIVINGYQFDAMDFTEPADEFPPPWWPNVEQEFMRRLPVLMQTWEQEYLPEVQAANQRLRDFDYEGASLAGLLSFVEEARELRMRAWELHMLAVIPALAVGGRFAETYTNLLGEPEAAEPYLMLGGFENMTVESGKALWRLSRRAKAEPPLTRIIAETPVERLPEAIQSSPEGKAFWAEFDAYLQEYGWRSDAFELADPAWTEDPSIALTQLRELMRAPDESDPALKQAEAMRTRERLVAETRERLDGNEGKPLFEMMLGVAQQYLPIQENHNFYIDQMNTVLLRKPFLELGRRLAEAGAIVERDDVFYIRSDELAEAGTNPTARDWRALVSERKVERERWSSVVPPRELGTPPSESMRQNPVGAAFFGTKVEPSSDPKVINGIGASAGTVTAPARIVRSLSEAGKLQPGDILVCEMTMPAWTPLFASVAAVVSDSGGVLSHCAIVAREYGVPCVVGTQVGTQVLKDGQRITVDGAQGIVRIEG